MSFFNLLVFQFLLKKFFKIKNFNKDIKAQQGRINKKNENLDNYHM